MLYCVTLGLSILSNYYDFHYDLPFYGDLFHLSS